MPFFHLDDENFRLAVFEQLNGRVNDDVGRLSCLKLNFYYLKYLQTLSLCKDIDPDSNMFSELGNCEYYVEEQFDDLLQKQKIDNNRSSFMNVNARSLQCNLCRLTHLLGNLTFRFFFIGITEIWLQDSSHNCNIPGYRFINKHRANTSGGGVGLYLADSLEFKWRSDISLSSDETAESLFVEVNRPKES